MLHMKIRNYKDKKFRPQIKQTFSNIEIFNIFLSNKKILLFLLKKEIIMIDDDIYNELFSKTDSNGNRYCHFFYPELKKFKGEEKVKGIEKQIIGKDSNIFDGFEEKREEGENDSFICSIIRQDSVKEFVEYVNRTNLSLRSEVNNLLKEKHTTLIEYSAFFGSIQIFQYLRLNDSNNYHTLANLFMKEIKKNFEKYSLFHTIIFEDKIEIIYYLLSNKNI